MLVSAKCPAAKCAGNLGGTAECLSAFRPIVDGRFFVFYTSPTSGDVDSGNLMEVRMLDKLKEIEKTALESLEAVRDPDALELSLAAANTITAGDDAPARHCRRVLRAGAGCGRL